MDGFNKTPNIFPGLNAIPSTEQQFRLNKINEIKYYFLAEIREKELISKNISKYIASLDYFDKSSIYIVRKYFYCIICNSYWNTCSNNWRKLQFYIFNYIRICKIFFKNNNK